VWIGHPPTYTPLHRDPNPNLFVQLAGEKVVRLLAPDEGQSVFAAVRAQLGKSGGRGAAAIRGEEMMQGGERALLDEAVWGDDERVFEAKLGAGDGLFIPKGWWHSIKGVGEDVTGSVSAFFFGFDLLLMVYRSIGGLDKNRVHPEVVVYDMRCMRCISIDLVTVDKRLAYRSKQLRANYDWL
jgi:hypothetical protein